MKGRTKAADAAELRDALTAVRDALTAEIGRHAHTKALLDTAQAALIHTRAELADRRADFDAERDLADGLQTALQAALKQLADASAPTSTGRIDWDEPIPAGVRITADPAQWPAVHGDKAADYDRPATRTADPS